MLLVLYFTFYFHYNIWGCMCSTGPFKYRWLKGYIYSSCYYHHQIGSIHLSYCFHIFPWLCAWDVCHIIFCHLLYIHPFVMIEIIYILCLIIIIKSEVWTITHCLRLGHETMVCAVCLSIFLWYLGMFVFNIIWDIHSQYCAIWAFKHCDCSIL